MIRASAFRTQDPRLGTGPFQAFAKIRQNHRPAPCQVMPTVSGEAEVHFDMAQRAWPRANPSCSMTPRALSSEAALSRPELLPGRPGHQAQEGQGIGQG